MLEKLALAGTVVAGLAIGLYWPTGQDRVPAAQTGANDVVIARNDDHHYYADADVNGQSIHFMIDTGASETALTEADAQKAGLSIDPKKYEVIGDGASGMVRGQYVELNSVKLGAIRQNHAKAVVVQGASVSLLGQPFLEQIEEITIRKGEMRLKPASSS